MESNHTSPGPLNQVVGCLPLKRGNRYQFPGYDSGFQVTFVALPGHPEHDGGWPGVGIQWIGKNFHRHMKRAFYTFKSEAEFWDCYLFKYAVDAPNPTVQPPTTDAAGTSGRGGVGCDVVVGCVLLSILFSIGSSHAAGPESAAHLRNAGSAQERFSLDPSACPSSLCGESGCHVAAHQIGHPLDSLPRQGVDLEPSLKLICHSNAITANAVRVVPYFVASNPERSGPTTDAASTPGVAGSADATCSTEGQ